MGFMSQKNHHDHNDPISRIFADAAEILRNQSEYSLGFSHSFVDKRGPEPVLRVSFQHRQVAMNQDEKQELELHEAPYLSGMKLLEDLGAKQVDIEGGFQRDSGGQAYLEEGTMGKEGRGAQRMYTKCEFSVPLSKLDMDQAIRIIKASKLAEEIKEVARALENRQSGSHFQIIRGSNTVEIALGDDYSEACGMLAELRQCLEKIIDPKRTSLTVNDILPALPDQHGDDNAVRLDVKEHRREGKLLLAAMKELVVQRRNERWKAQLPTDNCLEKLARIIESKGFPPVRLSWHREGESTSHASILIEFPSKLEQSRILGLRDALYQEIQKVDNINGLRLDGVDNHFRAIADPFWGQGIRETDVFPLSKLHLSFVETQTPKDLTMTVASMTMSPEEMGQLIKAVHRNCGLDSRAAGPKRP